MVAVSLRRFREIGCKTVGFITHSQPIANLFEQEAKKLKLKTAKEWIRLSAFSAISEIEGATLFKQLWSQETHPEGLLVYPDTLARGAMVSMYENRIRVPEDLHVIFHVNAELQFYCPLQVEWIVNHIIRIADGLITSIQRQVSGKAPQMQLIPLELRSVTDLAHLQLPHPVDG
jgi:DNA-binding LacI/PurR family transcriptional regulator